MVLQSPDKASSFAGCGFRILCVWVSAFAKEKSWASFTAPALWFFKGFFRFFQLFFLRFRVWGLAVRVDGRLGFREPPGCFLSSWISAPVGFEWSKQALETLGALPASSPRVQRIQ